MRPGDHLSQEAFIRFLDGETSPEENSLVHFHLGGCASCRAALAEFRLMGEDLKNIEFTLKPPISGSKDARALLKAKLAQTRRTGSASLRDKLRAFVGGRMFPDYFYGTVAAVGVAAIFLLVPNLHRSVAEISVSLPNRALTPGMTRRVNVQEMCASRDRDLDPTVSSSTQKAVFSEYGISVDHSAKDFQVDYLISPQLGGTDDVRNLWPQSYRSTTWNAEAKDKLESHLYQLVCEKKINLADAQHDIATNWIAAYQKYFRTSRPT